MKTKILAILMILAALIGAAVKLLDGDPNTKVDTTQLGETVKDGVTLYKSANKSDDGEAATTVTETETSSEK